jgi:hypothetical protein
MLYLALLTPSQGFGGRHLSVATPFVALCLAMAVERFAARLMPVLLLVACLIAAPAEFALSTLRPKFTSQISTAPQIVTNNLAGGIILRYALEARDDAKIFAARDLLAEHEWADSLGPDGIIILNPQYQDPQKFKVMKEAIVKDFPIVSGDWGETLHKRPKP